DDVVLHLRADPACPGLARECGALIGRIGWTRLDRRALARRARVGTRRTVGGNVVPAPGAGDGEGAESAGEEKAGRWNRQPGDMHWHLSMVRDDRHVRERSVGWPQESVQHCLTGIRVR